MFIYTFTFIVYISIPLYIQLYYARSSATIYYLIHPRVETVKADTHLPRGLTISAANYFIRSR